MKKISTLLFLALSGAASLHAQAPAAQNVLRHIRKHLADIGPACAPRPLLKGTAVQERLLSEAHFTLGSAGLVLTDSAQYSGSRRSSFDFNYLQYNELGTLENGTSTDFIEVSPTPNNVDSSNLPRVAFDTLHRYQLDLTGNLSYRNMELASYNTDTAMNSLTNLRFSGSTIDTGFRQTMTYNSAGRLKQVFDLHFDGSTWDTGSIRTIAYTSAGDILLDSVWIDDGPGGLASIRQIYYTYNSPGQYASRFQIFFNANSGSIDTSERATFIYYPNGQLHRGTYEFNYGNGLQLEYKDTFAYTPGVPGFTSFYEELFDVDSSVLLTFGMNTVSTNGQGLKDSVIVVFNGVDVGAVRLLYNTNGNPVNATLYDLTGGSPVIAEFRRWHYPASAAGVEISSSANDIRIYPNPTTGVITIDHRGIKAGTAVAVHVTNMAGQLVHAEALTVQGASQQITLGNEIAPGEYMITVRDNAGNLRCNRTIIKN